MVRWVQEKQEVQAYLKVSAMCDILLPLMGKTKKLQSRDTVRGVPVL